MFGRCLLIHGPSSGIAASLRTTRWYPECVPAMRACDGRHLNVSTTIGGTLAIAHRRCDSALAEHPRRGPPVEPEPAARADETVPSRRHGRPPPLPPAPGWLWFLMLWRPPR